MEEGCALVLLGTRSSFFSALALTSGPRKQTAKTRRRGFWKMRQSTCSSELSLPSSKSGSSLVCVPQHHALLAGWSKGQLTSRYISPQRGFKQDQPYWSLLARALATFSRCNFSPSVTGKGECVFAVVLISEIKNLH